MGKLKSGKCLYCGENLRRHDANRVSIKVGVNNGQNSYKEAHLKCKQEVTNA
jgi:hypothetical protein